MKATLLFIRIGMTAMEEVLISIYNPPKLAQCGDPLGDGTTNTIQSNWSVGSPINHTYAPSVDTFVVTISNLSGCIITGVVVMEQAASASIQIPVGGITQGCAPQAMDFINSSTNVSATTQFQWDFGDNSPDLFFDAQNSNQSVSHLYEPGTVSCETVVTLYAENYCNTIQGGLHCYF